MNKKNWMAGVLALAAVVAGCSSVSLDESKVPVEDRSGTAAATGTNERSGDPAALAQSRVASVTVDPGASQAVGPAGVGRVVYFDYDSVTIRPEFQSLIESHARFLRANSTRRIAVEGHTDERGGREYNLALGQRRAEAVRRALTLLGVPDAQVEAVSFGKEKPADAGANEAAWSKNRRAEINYR